MSASSQRAADRQHGERPPNWTVLYDGDCGFCKWLLSGFLAWDRSGHLAPVALQRPEAEALLADMPVAERMASWHLVSPTGERESGGAAIGPMLRLLPAGRLPAVVFEHLPETTDRSYRWVAGHRSQLSRWVPASLKRHASERVRVREHAQRT